MVDPWYLEELLAGGLALAIGILLVAAPGTVYGYLTRLYGADTGRGGRWGEDPEPSRKVVLALRAVGVAFIGFAVAMASAPWWR